MGSTTWWDCHESYCEDNMWWVSRESRSLQHQSRSSYRQTWRVLRTGFSRDIEITMYSERSIRRILEGDTRRLKDVLYIVKKARTKLKKLDQTMKICLGMLESHYTELLNLRRWLKELLKHRDIPRSVILFLMTTIKNLVKIGQKMSSTRGSRRRTMKILLNAFADREDKHI